MLVITANQSKLQNVTSANIMELPIPNRKIIKLHDQLNEIDQIVKALLNVKRKIISRFEAAKQIIRNFRSKEPSCRKNLSIVVTDRTASLLDRDISQIQNIHDVVVQDLEGLKKSLNTHISVIEKTELIMNILSYKLYEIQFTFRTEFDKLKGEKDSLTRLSFSGKEDPAVALRIVEIEDEITKLEETHQTNLDSIKEQKLDAQQAYERAVQVMDQNFDKMTNGLNKLMVLIEAQKSSLSDSQAQLIDSRFAEEIKAYKDDIEKFTELQTTGWKVLYPEEKISELLNERGLKILQSGHLITDQGHRITFKQAKQSKLFDDIEPDVLNELKANLIPNGDDDTTRSSVSSTSIDSRMSSEDVNYLKECLGRPLALALAEITSLQPRDPIHYLGHWLFKYRYNQQMEDVNNVEFGILNEKRNEIAKEKWHKFIEDEAKAAVIDIIIRAEETAIANELNRIQRETEAMEETEGFDDEARDILGPYTGPSTGQMPL